MDSFQANKPGQKQPSFFLSRWIFLRLLGVVYLAAFLSLWVQIHGLVGSRGILPVTAYLAHIKDVVGAKGYYLRPTLCWLDSSDTSLNVLCGGGAALSGLLVLGVAPVPVLVLLWAFYLSLTTAGQIFLGYQWDALLLETGFLAIFLAPLQLWPRLGQEAPPPRLVLWLFRWLLFRLIFGSGMVKLLSGDPTWRHLTALEYHYQTQPLPTWTSWYMHQLPAWFHQYSVLVTFAVELAVPLLICGPQLLRCIACGGIVALQVLIAATGNFGFFNLLTVALGALLLSDNCFPARWRARLALAETSGTQPQRWRWPVWLLVPLAVGLFTFSVLVFSEEMGLRVRWPAPLRKGQQVIASFQVVNIYGLFAVMTTQRLEIVVEGSNDGLTWKPYEFKWKPTDVRRRPAFTGLHMPRLDWQMWFAALGDYRRNLWFIHFLLRLLQGSPDVLALMEQNPFPDRPPRYIRAVLFDYHFTDTAARKKTGTWWRRQRLGPYCPVLTLPDAR